MINRRQFARASAGSLLLAAVVRGQSPDQAHKWLRRDDRDGWEIESVA